MKFFYDKSEFKDGLGIKYTSGDIEVDKALFLANKYEENRS